METGAIKKAALQFNTKPGAITIKKPKQRAFTISHDEGTKKMLDNIQWLEQFVISRKPISQGDIIHQALQLRAKEMDYEKLIIEYAEDLENAKK
jgi:hypothetical protein